ncbi:hypothetical protein HNQ93_002057 [Hymenobacter luteus]|uniref:Uncharacterized protein n=2 Tax=Hymenobacter TaxID=89966 RepID=A0A7W9WCB1_9BACT|nr:MULTISPECIES: hypothetical protein [Hymenobacter]MBB4600582.1 hypothetical protein [Hymenobacter latericoloratus]MBB6059211.1 hypothetical protein [Hymenobacter luteus]
MGCFRAQAYGLARPRQHLPATLTYHGLAVVAQEGSTGRRNWLCLAATTGKILGRALGPGRQRPRPARNR